MAAYPYRYRYRGRRRSGNAGPAVAVAVLAALLAASGAKAAAHHGVTQSQAVIRDTAAMQAIAYAKRQIGLPYRWGGTGPDAYDCSGLAVMAYRSAGVAIARTTFDQWRTEAHVSGPQPGDLVFFAGSDGTMTDPGHVGIVIGHGQMIQALGTGYPVMVSSYHRPDLVGFTDPASLAATTAAAVRVSVPSGSTYTPASWAAALLTAGGWPRTSCNLAAVTAWEHGEGGGFGNQAAYNPLNVNPGPGAGWPGRPAIGAWAFPDDATGLRYTVATLRNGYYGAILAALRAGDSAQAVCDAIMASPWAASRYGGTLTASC